MIKASVVYRIVTDHLGSVRHVVDAQTGAVLQEMDYDEYGNVLNHTNPALTPFGFAGGVHDSQTKLARYGARDYDARMGRWLTKDQIRFQGRTANLYAYVSSDPINAIDPKGEMFGIANFGYQALGQSLVAGAVTGTTSVLLGFLENPRGQNAASVATNFGTGFASGFTGGLVVLRITDILVIGTIG